MDNFSWRDLFLGMIGLWVGTLTYIWREHVAKVKCLMRRSTDIPQVYVRKDECAMLHTQNKVISDKLIEKMNEGFERVYDKLDKHKEDTLQRYDKLQEQIIELHSGK